MLSFSPSAKVYLAAGSTDMRKSIDGLSALVSQDFALDPFDQSLFVFCMRRDRRWTCADPWHRARGTPVPVAVVPVPVARVADPRH